MPIKLTYTDQMKTQDKLWADQKEDLNEMEKLYKQIIQEAESKGFTGVVHIYSTADEMMCQLFNNKKEQELAVLGKFDDYIEVGYCKPLIEHLEEILNK